MIRPLFVLYLVLLLICSVTGIICTRRLKFTFSPIKLLPWFILLTLMSELTALWYAIQSGNNHKVYNVYQIVHFGFYSYILALMIGHKGVKKLLAGLSALFTAFAIMNLSCIQGMVRFNTVNFFGGAIILSFFSGYSLSELFKKAATESPFKIPSFWINGSILMLNSCMIPLVLPATLNLHFTPGETHILSALNMLVNYISYTMFTIAFLNYHKNNKRSHL